jgi:hypothetical protein
MDATKKKTAEKCDNLKVSISHDGETVETDTDTLKRIADGGGPEGGQDGKRKPVKVELIELYEIPGNSVSGKSEPYRVLDFLRSEFREDLEEAKIVLVWRLDVPMDKDGKIELGKCHKRTDLDKELGEKKDLPPRLRKDIYKNESPDCIITLNREAWQDFTANQRHALMFHELCHFVPVLDPQDPAGEAFKRDERGRICYRVRKHDIEEFGEVVQRFGLYKRDLEEFAKKCFEGRQTPLFDKEAAP